MPDAKESGRETADIEKLAVFCKKKGFVFRTSEIYGGLSGFYDFGPLGVELKNNVKRLLWKRFVQDREDVVGIDGSIITHPKVWKASGHVDSFADLMLSCSNSKCSFKARADTFIEDSLARNVEGLSPEEIQNIVDDNSLKCPVCGSDFEKVSSFNLMFSTKVGPAGGITSYLRPETAQLIFTNFKQVLDSSRVKIPFGIAQIGKAFRNEISPRDFLFRTREFEQFEIEFFTKPDEEKCPLFEEVSGLKVSILDASGTTHKISLGESVRKGIIHSEWIAYWLGSFYRFFTDYGIAPENLRIREHHKEELAHYAKGCYDIEYRFPFGWKEIHGNADRGTFDLSRHSEHSGKDLSVFDEVLREKFVPAVSSEPSQGIERAMLAFLFDAYHDDTDRGNIVLKLHPALAPVKIGIFPLVNKLEDKARKVFESLREIAPSVFDRSGSIGRRYARADEQGIPFCITVDFDNGVTIRDRDTTKQVRVPEGELKQVISGLVSGTISFGELADKYAS